MGLRLNDVEAIELQGAAVFVFESDVRQSTGCLFLDPGASLDKHNRPVEEWLVQIEGESVVKTIQ